MVLMVSNTDEPTRDLLHIPQEEIEGSFHGVIIGRWKESMPLVGIDMALTGEALHAAKLDDLLRVHHGNVVIALAMQN